MMEFIWVLRVMVLVLVAGLMGWWSDGWASEKKVRKSGDAAEPYRQCLRRAADAYQIHPRLLGAIVRVENGGWNPIAISVNRQGRGYPLEARSYSEAVQVVTDLWKRNDNFDVGLGQVNTVNMERFRIHPVALLEPCTNLRYAARILRESIDRHGYNWTAIERYNGINPMYSWKVLKELQGLK